MLQTFLSGRDGASAAQRRDEKSMSMIHAKLMMKDGIEDVWFYGRNCTTTTAITSTSIENGTRMNQ